MPFWITAAALISVMAGGFIYLQFRSDRTQQWQGKDIQASYPELSEWEDTVATTSLCPHCGSIGSPEAREITVQRFYEWSFWGGGKTSQGTLENGKYTFQVFQFPFQVPERAKLLIARHLLSSGMRCVPVWQGPSTLRLYDAPVRDKGRSVRISKRERAAINRTAVKFFERVLGVKGLVLFDPRQLKS